MWPAISIAVVVLGFFAVAVILSRRGLHRSLDAMPLLAGETTLAELRDLELVCERGDARRTRVTYRGCTVRVTNARLLVAQQLGSGGQNRVLSIVLSPAGETAMRLVDADAIDRPLKSFSVGRVVAGSLGPTREGGVSVSMEYLGPVLALPNPARWEFPPSAAPQLADALRAAGVC